MEGFRTSPVGVTGISLAGFLLACVSSAETTVYFDIQC